VEPAARRSAERDDPAQRAPGRPDHDRTAGPDLAHDPCHRAVHGLVELATGHPPAAAPVEEQLAVDDPLAGLRLGRLGDDDITQSGIADAFDDGRSRHDRLPGSH
jgi:hypothetical protein